MTGSDGLIIVETLLGLTRHSYVYHSDDLANNGTETLIAILPNVDVSDLSAGDFVFG